MCIRDRQDLEDDVMSIGQRLVDELKALAVTALYFLFFIGMLLVLKKLVLAEYQIGFKGLSVALVGTLVLSKVVLILEHVSLGGLTRGRPAWVDVVLRTALYSLGVLVVLLLEKAFEGRHEHGGFVSSLLSIFQHAEIPHVWANAICLSGALLGYNILTVFRRHLGPGGLLRMLMEPLPAEPAPGSTPRPTADS
jgi:hypothetical protein